MSDKFRLGLRLVLQAAGSITIPEGGVPVIPTDHGGDPTEKVAIAVNFLRCGSPAVQFLFGSFHTNPKIKDTIQGVLDLLQLEGENFQLEGQINERNESVLTLQNAKET